MFQGIGTNFPIKGEVTISILGENKREEEERERVMVFGKCQGTWLGLLWKIKVVDSKMEMIDGDRKWVKICEGII